MLLLQVIQFIPLNLDASPKIDRAVPPMLDIFAGKWWFTVYVSLLMYIYRPRPIT